MENKQELKKCPFCGGEAETKVDVSKSTLEGALASEKLARCSTPTCLARFVHCSVSEWNTRAESKQELDVDAVRKLLDNLVTSEGLQFQVVGESKIPTHRKDILSYISNEFVNKFKAPKNVGVEKAAELTSQSALVNVLLEINNETGLNKLLISDLAYLIIDKLNKGEGIWDMMKDTIRANLRREKPLRLKTDFSNFAGIVDIPLKK